MITSLFIFLSVHLSSAQTTIQIRNNCPFTVWAAAIPGGGARLDYGTTWTYIPDGRPDDRRNPRPNRIWGRTNCNFDSSGEGKCQTGDCNGFLDCKGFGTPPNTLAEYMLNSFNSVSFFDVSLVDGFNLPMEFGPAASTADVCSARIRCTADIIGQCPAELRTPGGCHSPCTVFTTTEYCCTSGNCGPTNYSRFFKDRCPTSYSYPQDDATSTFTCPSGTNYRVVFCP